MLAKPFLGEVAEKGDGLGPFPVPCGVLPPIHVREHLARLCARFRGRDGPVAPEVDPALAAIDADLDEVALGSSARADAKSA